MTIIAHRRSGTNSFLGFAQTPESFAGQAGRHLIVNSEENALEFASAVGFSSFVGLSDTPDAPLTAKALLRGADTAGSLVFSNIKEDGGALVMGGVNISGAGTIGGTTIIASTSLVSDLTVTWNTFGQLNREDRLTGLGSAVHLMNGSTGEPLVLLHTSRTDGASNIVFASVYDRNAAAITNAATMRLHSFGWTNDADVYTELAAVYADGDIECVDLRAGINVSGINVSGSNTIKTASNTIIISGLATDPLVGLGAMHSIKTSSDRSFGILNMGRTDVLGTAINAVGYTVWGIDAAPVNAATMRLHSFGITSAADTYAEKVGIYADGHMVLGGTTDGEILGQSADGAAAIGLIVGSENNFTTAGALLLSVQNNGVEKTSIDKDGDITTSGDLTVDGSLTQYGGLSVAGNAAATTISASGTYYQFTGFDTDSPNRDATPANASDDITVNTAGDYLITWTASMSSAGNNDVVAVQVEKNNGATTIAGSLVTHELITASKVESISATCIATLAVSDTVELWIANETDTDNITIEDASLTITRIG